MELLNNAPNTMRVLHMSHRDLLVLLTNTAPPANIHKPVIPPTILDG